MLKKKKSQPGGAQIWPHLFSSFMTVVVVGVFASLFLVNVDTRYLTASKIGFGESVLQRREDARIEQALFDAQMAYEEEHGSKLQTAINNSPDPNEGGNALPGPVVLKAIGDDTKNFMQTDEAKAILNTRKEFDASEPVGNTASHTSAPTQEAAPADERAVLNQQIATKSAEVKDLPAAEATAVGSPAATADGKASSAAAGGVGIAPKEAAVKDGKKDAKDTKKDEKPEPDKPLTEEQQHWLRNQTEYLAKEGEVKKLQESGAAPAEIAKKQQELKDLEKQLLVRFVKEADLKFKVKLQLPFRPLKPGEDHQVIEGADGEVLLQLYASEIYKWLAGAAGILAVLMIAVAGIQISTSGAGDSVSDAKDRIMGAFAGLALLFLSGLILHTINPTFFV